MLKRILTPAALLGILPLTLGAGVPEIDFGDAEPVAEVYEGQYVVITSVTAPEAFENLAPGQTVAWDLHIEAVGDAGVRLDVQASGDLSIDAAVLASDEPLEFGGQVGELLTPDTGIIGEGNPAEGVVTDYGYVADAGTVRIYVTSSEQTSGVSSYVTADVSALPAETVFPWYRELMEQEDPTDPDDSGWEEPEKTTVTPPSTDKDAPKAERGEREDLATTGASILALLMIATSAVVVGAVVLLRGRVRNRARGRSR